MPTVHLLIQGKVQGVFYRATAKKMAEAFGISGWVTNTPDGHVEVLAQGNQANIESFIAWCKQGPPNASVANLAVTQKEDEKINGFYILKD